MGTEVDPLENERDAWLVMVLPERYTNAELDEFHERAIRRFQSDSKQDEERFIAAIEQFGLRAIEPSQKSAADGDLVHEEPALITLAAAYASMIVDRHSKYDEMTDGFFKPEKQLLTELTQTWGDHIYYTIRTHEDGATLLQKVAEVVYSRDREDDLGPPGGRVCTGIYTIDELDGTYVELTIQHANPTYEARDENGNVTAKIRDGRVYVPIADLDERLESLIASSFDRHRNHIEGRLEPRELAWLTKTADRLTGAIDRMFESRDYERLFDGGRYPRNLSVIMDAVREYDYGTVDFGEWVTAKKIYNAIRYYNAHPRQEYVVDSITGPMSVSKILSGLEDHRDVDVNREGRVNEYRLRDGVNDCVSIDVEEPRDILELPCLNNMDEYLQENGPVRGMLYSVARMLMSLDNDFTIDEMVEFFEPYEWFDEEITRYQLRYESNRSMDDGTEPLPLGCETIANGCQNHDDIQTLPDFCIGLDECSYSIYSSLSFKQDVYDRLES